MDFTCFVLNIQQFKTSFFGFISQFATATMTIKEQIWLNNCFSIRKFGEKFTDILNVLRKKFYSILYDCIGFYVLIYSK